MTDPDDSNAIFEINDFTIVTPIEELSASFENLVQKWGLYDRRPVNKDSNYKVVTKDIAVVNFGENKLKFELKQPIYKTELFESVHEDQDHIQHSDVDEETELVETLPFAVVEEIGNVKQTFENLPRVSTEFGIREYILISPNNESNDMISSESQANTILGALKASVFSNRCEVPVFVAVKENAQDVLHGYASDGTVYYTFSTAVLRNFNRNHHHLYGLLKIFKDELNGAPRPDEDDIRITTRFHHYFPLKYANYEHLASARSMNMMPLGPKNIVPIESFTITATWKIFREDVLTETDTHTDFDINYSTNWLVTANPSEEIHSKGVLEKTLRVFSGHSTDRIKELPAKIALGTFFVEQGVGNALEKLSIMEPSKVRIGNNQDQEAATGITGPLTPSLVSAWVATIFQEDGSNEWFDTELSTFASSNLQRMQKHGDDYKDRILNLDEFFYNDSGDTMNTANYKAALQNSIAWKLATAMSNVLIFNNGNVRSEPQLWLAFVRRLREKYEKNQDIDVHDPSGEIDLSQCFLTQKLQLLQACVVARRKRHALLSSNSDCLQDEFFDAQTDFNQPGEEKQKEETNRTSQGRLKRLGQAMLIGNPSEHLYVPITQDRSPMTEDMLEKHTEYLCELSEDERVLAQLEPLRSDMMSFKAANPGCTIGDFLRWHSPKDFDESTQSLSERMNAPGNTWLQCWESTKPQAVINQSRLFNETKVAEEVLELFETAKIEQYREWLKPIVFVSGFQRLLIAMKNPAILNEKCMNESSAYAQVLQVATQTGKLDNYEEVMRWMTKMEIRANLSYHLLHLFTKAKSTMHDPQPSTEELRSLINGLVDVAVHHDTSNSVDLDPSEGSNVIVLPQHALGRALALICGFDKNAGEKMKKPERKEYIISWNTDRPSGCGTKLPQRMYVSLEKEFNQLCFSLGQDCQFSNADTH